MGWLEILPLLRRLLPLLHQTVPMLERSMARGNNAASAGSSASAASIDAFRADLQALDNGHRILGEQLRQNTTHLEALSELVQQNTRVSEVYATQLRETDARLASLTTWVKAAAALSAVTLLAIIVWLSILMHVGRPA